MGALARRFLIFFVGFCLGAIARSALIAAIWESFMPKRADDLCLIGIVSIFIIFLALLLLLPDPDK